MNEALRQRHAWTNALQTGALILSLLGLNVLAGMLLLGEDGVWIALAASAVALLIEPTAGMHFTLRLYRAQPISAYQAPDLWRGVEALAERAGLPSLPALYYVPSPVINAFALGGRTRSAIALSDGLLRRLTPREILGVLGHEIAHIAHGDLRVMGLADFVSRLTSLYALAGQLLLLLALPAWILGAIEINWLALVVLVASPWLAQLAQLGLSRVREFDADQAAAGLTGDPQGLASALHKVEHSGRSWRGIFLPGWGNPQPSWLRTHPPTEERILRLLSMVSMPRLDVAWQPQWPINPSHDLPLRAARWRLGGGWW